MDGKYKVQLYKAGRHPQCTEVLGEGGGGDSEIIEFYLSGTFNFPNLESLTRIACTETITETWNNSSSFKENLKNTKRILPTWL